MFPSIYSGKPIYAKDLQDLMSEIKSARITSVTGGSFTRGIHGTCINVFGASQGGGGGNNDSLWDVSLSPKPNYEGQYLFKISNLGFVFNSIHYSDYVIPANNVDDVTWSGSFDIVWAQLNWGENGFTVSVECGSSYRDWETDRKSVV